jgi:hypothetical protein
MRKSQLYEFTRVNLNPYICAKTNGSDIDSVLKIAVEDNDCDVQKLNNVCIKTWCTAKFLGLEKGKRIFELTELADNERYLGGVIQ